MKRNVFCKFWQTVVIRREDAIRQDITCLYKVIMRGITELYPHLYGCLE